jgi:hypothetical protein
MTRRHSDRYSEKIGNNTLEIHYNYTYTPASHYDQEEEQVDITKVYANDKEITDFFWHFFDTDTMHDRVLDFARGNQ